MADKSFFRSNKATHTVDLCPQNTPGYTSAPRLTQESANRASGLLTINHALYHNRWNAGFHNHIAHHLLAIWALGGTPDELTAMWDYNEPYQAPIDRDHEAIPEVDLTDPKVFNDCLGRDEYYVDFLKFFRDEIDKKGVPDVVREYVLLGDERANDIFARMYTDLVHPMIHLGCALEFNQPSLVAEALAAACVHDNWPKDFLLATEEYVRANQEVPETTILNMLEGMSRDPVIKGGVKQDDPFNKIADGLMKRVTGDQFAPHLAQFQVKPTRTDLQKKTSEMMHTAAYVMGAAQRPGKREAIDFVLLHNATLSAFYPAILALSWMTLEEKARLIEAKARVDSVMYAACGCPDLYPSRIADYVPLQPQHDWPELFHRSIVYKDEGHAVKLIRALFALERHFPSIGTEHPISKADFKKIAHMSMDSIERAMQPGGTKMSKEVADTFAKRVGHGGEMVVDNQTRWIFYGGLPKAWDFVPEVST